MVEMGRVCALTLSILATGYRLEWEDEPAPPKHLNNHPSAANHKEFVTAAVAEGVRFGTMRQCRQEDLRCILPLGVAANSAQKLRMIWDGRWVNRYLRDQSFHMDALHREGRALMEDSVWGGTFDISQAYHHVDMHDSTWQFLGFEWDGRFYHFTVLPFGLSCAPRIFTVIMKTTVAYLRWQGVRVMAYLDDLIFGARSKIDALRDAHRMLRTLQDFGWLVNADKCVGLETAVQAFVALGTLVDLHRRKFLMTDRTMERIRTAASSLLESEGEVPVRVVAAVRGLISSTWVATGVAARIRTRSLDADIERRSGQVPGKPRASWNGTVTLSPSSRADLRWWLSNLDKANGQDIVPGATRGRLDGLLQTDASDVGFGGWLSLDESSNGHSSFIQRLIEQGPGGTSVRRCARSAREGIEIAGRLPDNVLGSSSTFRELYGLHQVLRILAPLMCGGRFRAGLDNAACVFILGGTVPAQAPPRSTPGGSRVPELQSLAIQILDVCDGANIDLEFFWTPRELNVRADALSRAAADMDEEFSVRWSVFRRVDAWWGPHTVDRFATAVNMQPLQPPFTGRFCSRFFDPAALVVDALSEQWTEEGNWCCPPVHLIYRVINHVLRGRSRATLVVPRRRDAIFWPLLFPDGARGAPAPIVRGLRELGPGHAVLYCPGRGSLPARLADDLISA
mmetsp:Transcript_74836/g.200622  ORF Transcript_74836/g.200622 Transcript_74836/m.200622 type:complete len:681 (+) Transcript_74836:204-2246(+)